MAARSPFEKTWPDPLHDGKARDETIARSHTRRQEPADPLEHVVLRPRFEQRSLKRATIVRR
jgi:hypothetical protein